MQETSILNTFDAAGRGEVLDKAEAAGPDALRALGGPLLEAVLKKGKRAVQDAETVRRGGAGLIPGARHGHASSPTRPVQGELRGSVLGFFQV